MWSFSAVPCRYFAGIILIASVMGNSTATGQESDREPSVVKIACRDLVLTQYRNSDKRKRDDLCVGDRILKWGDAPLKDNRDLIRHWLACYAGDVSQITVERNFGTDKEPDKQTLVIPYRHIGASDLYGVCMAGGRMAYPAPDKINPELDQLPPSPFLQEVEKVLGDKRDAVLEPLSAAFRRLTDQVRGHYRNDQVVYLLNHPFRAEDWSRKLTDRLVSLPSLEKKISLLWRISDPQFRELPKDFPAAEAPSAIQTILAQIEQIDTAYDQAFAPLSAEERTELMQWCRDFQPRYQGGDGWDAFQSGYQLTKRIDLEGLKKAVALSGQLAQQLTPDGPLFRRLATEIESAQSTAHITVGTDGDDKILVSTPLIVDPGGNDHYAFVDSDEHFWTRIIVDMGGDDTFTGESMAVAAGIMRTSILVDAAGDDIYDVDRNGIGFGLIGLGLLYDANGNDRYLGSLFSQGVASLGIGLVYDLSGNDRYDSGSFSQALGLAAGCGAILDSAGDDVYLCTGKHPSPYGDAGEFSGWGQGCGFGFRYLTSGGIGLLVDEAGHDVYRAGQFGLGCGYFFGLGLVNDRGGNDFYECSRYGLGTGAHYAVGLMLDDQGNDVYSAIRSTCVAVIGSSWDLCLGMLVDAEGNDIYRGVSYAMAGAAQTSYGFLWDKSGDDIYESHNAQPGAVLGYIGGASYGGGRMADNLAAFLDGGGDDVYLSPGRDNQESGIDGEYGVWIDK